MITKKEDDMTDTIFYIAGASDMEYGNPMYSTMAVFTSMADAVAHIARVKDDDSWCIWTGTNSTGFIQFADADGTPF
jgi:hypothetical protein